MTDFYQTFIEIMAMWPATKMSSADLENVGHGHHLHKSYRRYYMSDFNQSFTKMMHLGLAAKAAHQLTQLTFKM